MFIVTKVFKVIFFARDTKTFVFAKLML